MTGGGASRVRRESRKASLGTGRSCHRRSPEVGLPGGCGGGGGRTGWGVGVGAWK